MRYLLSVLLLFTSSCALISIPSHTTKHGVKFHDKTDDRANIQPHSLEEVVGEFVDAFKIPLYVVDGTHIYLYSKLIHVPNPDAEEMIVTDGFSDRQAKTILVSVFTNCLGNSSMVHELAHLFFADKDHKQKAVWDKVESIENKLKSQCTSKQMVIDKEERDPDNGNTG